VDGNRAIEPQEMATVMSEKGLIVYDQKTWDLRLAPGQKDKQGVPVPGWQDVEKAGNFTPSFNLKSRAVHTSNQARWSLMKRLV
jgi:hypothetical protein